MNYHFHRGNPLLGGRASAEALEFAVAFRYFVENLNRVADPFAILVDEDLNDGVRRADA